VSLAAATALAGGPRNVVDRIETSFAAPPAPAGARSEHVLTLSGNFRAQYWGVAWTQYREHVLGGSGGGTFEVYWLKERSTIYGTRDAHNLYLETLAELGPVGLSLLLATLALPFAAVSVAERSPWRSATAGAYAAVLVHAAVDWDWEMPTVMLAAVACAGALLLGGPGRRVYVSARARGAILAAVATVAAFTLSAYRANAAADDSAAAAAAGDYRTAVARARTVTRWSPWASSGWRLLGEAQLARSDRARARRSFGVGLRKDPEEWSLWYDLAVASEGQARRRAVARALALNPYDRKVRGLAAAW